MEDPRTGGANDKLTRSPADRLDSWKKIAAYLKREVSTVQRWERREGMPVHRHLHDKLGSVFAYRSELDAWWESRRLRLEPQSAAPEPLEPSAPAPAGATAGTRAPRLRKLAPWAVVAASLCGTAVLLWLATLRGEAWRDPLAGAVFARLPGFAGTPQAAAISRDGKSVAFFAARDGRTDVWFGEIPSGTYRNLTHGALGELADNPSIRPLGFSADSSLVSIWVRRADGSQPGDVNIFAAPVTGGAAQLYLRDMAEFDWSGDGQRLVYHTTAPGDPLFVREPGASADRRIYVAPAGVHCHFPLWSIDGAFVYFVRGVPPAGEWDIWRIRPAGTGLERITNHNTLVSYPVILDRRTLLYLATDVDGSGPWLYAVDVEQRLPHRIRADLERYTSLGASADGRRLIATIARRQTSLWRVTLGATAAAGSAVSLPAPLTAGGAAPRLGPDFLLYVSSRSGRPGVWKLSHGTAQEIWSGTPGSVIGTPAISPDGRRVVFSVAGADPGRLYLMNHDGSQARVLTEGLALRGSPAWAPDGAAIIVALLRDGEPQLSRISLGHEAPLPLVPEYSLDPVWSPDGRFLVYTGADVGTTFPVRAAAADGRPYPLPGLMLTRGARRVAFLGNARSLAILGGGIGHKNFRLFDLTSGAERALLELPADFIVRDFDVAPDGSEIVFERVQEDSELALIERKP